MWLYELMAFVGCLVLVVYGCFMNVLTFNVIMDVVLLMIDHYVELLIDVLR